MTDKNPRPSRLRVVFGEHESGTVGGAAKTVQGEVIGQSEYLEDFGEYEREVETALQEEQDMVETERMDIHETVGADVASSSSIVSVRRGRGGRFERLSDGEGSRSTPKARLRKKDDSWLLKTTAPGGPEVLDVIPSFGGHVAFDLYSHPERCRGVLRTWTKGQALKCLDQWKMSNDVNAIVEASGLNHLKDCMPNHLDLPLITAFIERWQPDTNTFHMPFGEMTITLHDVEEILMLPIEGKLCRGDEGDGKLDMMTLFSCTTDELMAPFMVGKPKLFQNGGVLAEALMRLLSGVGADTQAQAYLLYLIGCTLFVDKSGDRIRPTYYSLLRDVNKVYEYAWGAGTLAYLYRSLGIASRASCKGVDGCLALLQCWIYEYFPTLHPTSGMLVGRDEIPERCPRARFWVCRGTRRVSDEVALRDLRIQIDQLTPDKVMWCPYGPQPCKRYPRTLFRGVIRFLEFMEPYHPDRCLRQFGFVQTILPPILRPDQHCRSRVAKNYKVKFEGRVYDDSWNHLATSSLIPDRFTTTGAPYSLCVPDYLKWYFTHSHPFVIDPDRLGLLLAVDRAQLVNSAGHRIFNVFLPFYQGMPLDQVWERCQSLIAELGPVVYQYYELGGVPQWPPPICTTEAEAEAETETETETQTDTDTDLQPSTDCRGRRRGGGQGSFRVKARRLR